MPVLDMIDTTSIEGMNMDLDDLIGVALQHDEVQSVDDLIRRSATALDALRAIHADLVTRHGRDEGFEQLTLHLVKSSLRSAERAVGLAGLLAILLVKEDDRAGRIDDVARFIYNTDGIDGVDHYATASEVEKNLVRLKANAYLAIFNGITGDPEPKSSPMFFNFTMCVCGENQRASDELLGDNMFAPHDDPKTGQPCPGMPINH